MHQEKAVGTTVAVALFSKFKPTPPAMCLSWWLTLACTETFKMSILQSNCLIYGCVSLISAWMTHRACSTKPGEFTVFACLLIACLREVQNAAFTLAATHELIRAAKLLGWLQVTPVLQRMASNFTAEIARKPCCTAPHANVPPAKSKAVAEACEAVLLLLGLSL